MDISGGILFTTLEPCTSRNKHKPCSDWIIEKGIKEVYVGLLDPNPKIYNQGCTKLRNAGLEVSFFPRDLREEIKKDNNEFTFETRWSKDGNTHINIDNHKHDGSIKTVAIASGHNEIKEVKDGEVFDSSSDSRHPATGQIVIIENMKRLQIVTS